jgi:quercetin dioxygenase-like cupin family protein
VPEDLDIEAALAELEEKLPGLAGHMEVDDPGMHTTATVDMEVVLSGQVVLELDDGATRTMGPGDVIVQNGTRHRWSNPGDEPAVLAVFIVGAHHDRVP